MNRSTDRWSELERLYQAALDRDPSARAAFLQEACADESLRREVLSLLDARNAGDDLLERPAIRYAAAELAPPRALAHYRVEVKVGEGGMGAVYRAYDTQLRRPVALKVLPPAHAADPERRYRLLREARAAAALSHPNIVGIHEVGSDQGVDFIAMEFVEGKTLQQLIPAIGLPLAKALDYAAQIAAGLAKAHSAGVIHRDLKPGNIMVTRDGLVKVLDFGLARRAPLEAEQESTLTRDGEIAGTPAFMSPEQAQGHPPDARSDVFSFGSVLYEMTTGRCAFQRETRISTLSAVLNDDPAALPADVPPELRQIILRCLRKDPLRRFQNMDDVKIALEDIRAERDSGAAETPQPGAARRARYWIAGGILGLAIAAAWLVGGRGATRSGTPRLLQLTAVGHARAPTFAPDGTQVGFTWGGEQGDNRDVYIKLIGDANPLRLTTDPANDSWPAWSPDGRRIAFLRDNSGAIEIWWVSSLGGAEHKVADQQVFGPLAWSPDSKWLAAGFGYIPGAFEAGPVRGIFLIPADGGEPRRITAPNPPAYDLAPAFSPDGRLLAFASCSFLACDVFVQDLDRTFGPRGDPRRITTEGFGIKSLAWSRDGASIIYDASPSWTVTPRLRRVGIVGGKPSEVLEFAGTRAMSPCVAATGERLAFMRSVNNRDIWRWQPGGVATPLLVSTLLDYNAQFSPDGKRIAFQSDRAGEVVDIWTADADGSRRSQLTRNFGHGQGTPRWSPDGRWIVFDSLGSDGKSQIYVVNSTGGPPRRITAGLSNDTTPSFSRNGHWIYFSSDQTGRNEIWRIPVGGGTPHKITENGGLTAFESADGSAVYYTKTTTSPLFTRSLDGGPERLVLNDLFYRSFAPFQDGIYYIARRGADGRFPIKFHEFSTGTSRVIGAVDGPLELGFSVSPDRQDFLFTKVVATGSDLMLIESFR